MSPFAEASVFLVQSILHLLLLTVILRFLLQLAKADFYNPISQAIVKVTNPLLKPLRRLIPGLFGLDIASIVLALIIQVLAIYSCALIMGYGIMNPLSVAVWSLIGLASFVINLFFIALIISVIVSWVAPGNRHPALLLMNQLLEPLVGPLRKIIPPLGGLDFSVLAAFLIIQVCKIFLAAAPMSPAVRAIVLGIF